MGRISRDLESDPLVRGHVGGDTGDGGADPVALGEALDRGVPPVEQDLTLLVRHRLDERVDPITRRGGDDGSAGSLSAGARDNAVMEKTVMGSAVIANTAIANAVHANTVVANGHG